MVPLGLLRARPRAFLLPQPWEWSDFQKVLHKGQIDLIPNLVEAWLLPIRRRSSEHSERSERQAGKRWKEWRRRRSQLLSYRATIELVASTFAITAATTSTLVKESHASLFTAATPFAQSVYKFSTIISGCDVRFAESWLSKWRALISYLWTSIFCTRSLSGTASFEIWISKMKTALSASFATSTISGYSISIARIISQYSVESALKRIIQTRNALLWIYTRSRKWGSSIVWIMRKTVSNWKRGKMMQIMDVWLKKYRILKW